MYVFEREIKKEDRQKGLPSAWYTPKMALMTWSDLRPRTWNTNYVYQVTRLFSVFSRIWAGIQIRSGTDRIWIGAHLRFFHLRRQFNPLHYTMFPQAVLITLFEVPLNVIYCDSFLFFFISTEFSINNSEVISSMFKLFSGSHKIWDF